MTASQTHQLAQINIGILKGPLDSPQIKGFKDGLDPMNALADASPGFVWRLESEETGNATDIQAFEDEEILINMSVWEDIDSLKAYTYQSQHVEFVRQRRDWFEKMDSAHFVMWWVPVGHIPTLAEARERLAHYQAHGETAVAFTFKRPFSATGQPLRQ